jgi:hypothetical protein
MTLGFSTKWPKQMGGLAGQPNYFIDKIWHTLIDDNLSDASKLDEYSLKHRKLFGDFWHNDFRRSPGKNHTIRAGHRWKAGMIIHPVIKNRTKNRFQFAPTMPCKSVQKIEIEYEEGSPNVYINNQLIYWHTKRNTFGELKMREIAINDGFDSVEDFFAYFNTDFKGQIIHWTNLKY